MTPILDKAVPASEVVLNVGQRMIKTDEGNYVVLQAVDPNELEVTHEFADGFYIRGIVFPAGFNLVGLHHPHDTVNVVLSGRMTCIIDGKLMEVVAPCAFTNKPGTKIGFAKESTYWKTIHPNPDNEQDLAVLDARIHDRSKSHTPDIQNQNNAFLLALGGELIK